ncbi:UNVERIFIED_CONTAM: Cell division control protein 48C [Sesamum calycinum]|uniref:Cell division control protein 48C n=1 Tax=Sesamum calycinum TaxID=2727403 RepID=A0AAW2RR30_9LAMI
MVERNVRLKNERCGIERVRRVYPSSRWSTTKRPPAVKPWQGSALTSRAGGPRVALNLCGELGDQIYNVLVGKPTRTIYYLRQPVYRPLQFGASEENIRELFSKAYRTAPSIVFIDEIDAIASKRENLQREMERRIVTQLMTCMDESHRLVKPNDENADSESSNCRPGYVLVIGATNRPDAVDPALRRPGRFDREIVLGVPDECARVQILSVLTCNLKVEGAFDLVKIARSTPGFVGADLAALANKAGNLAMKRIIDKRKVELSKESEDRDCSEDWWRQPWSHEEMERLSITMADFEEAAKMVQPSSRREGFSTIPNVKWDDVGGLHLLREEFDRYIVRRIKFPEDYEDFGVDLETGFLLYGPPGCGKTLIAKAVANEAGANFIHIKGPELLNKYVGESELAVRTIFSRARTCSPCILFFDEVDALTTKRGKEGGWVVERLLNQLDGAEQRRGVYVIGATNRPEVMDRAVLRPGRFGKLLYVPLPSPDERGMILKALARKKPIDANMDLMALGEMMNEAAMAALEEKLTSSYRSLDGVPWTIKMYISNELWRKSPLLFQTSKYNITSFYQKASKLHESRVDASNDSSKRLFQYWSCDGGGDGWLIGIVELSVGEGSFVHFQFPGRVRNFVFGSNLILFYI